METRGDMRIFNIKIPALLLVVTLFSAGLPQAFRAISENNIKTCCCLSQGKACTCDHKNVTQADAGACSMRNEGCGTKGNGEMQRESLIAVHIQPAIVIAEFHYTTILSSFTQPIFISKTPSDIFHPPRA
ncbi:MAG TPA: hypothetical protein PLG25_13485 [bacterium]|nr:hypothetical protein [bacterium]HNI12525.1 hypothetical protein [bacterium]